MRRSGRAPRPPGVAPAAAARPLELWLAGAVAALALLARYADALRQPFINDDYVFLDATRHRAFASLWGFAQPFFGWWRPWSREFHYWALQRLAGPSEPVFHALNLLLAAAALALYFDLVRALAGRGRAAFATAAAAAMAAWALPLLWVAGVQDLWMLVWSLAALGCWRRDRRAAAFAAYALAVMSKETAALLPLLFVAWDALVARRGPVPALLRALPAALVLAPWAWAHPQLGGRFLRHVVLPASGGAAGPGPLAALGRSMLALASADAAPAPGDGWGAALRAGALAALLLGAFVLRFARGAPRAERATPGAARFGLAWCAVGWAPLLLPGLGWHAYYGLFGALGAWLALGARVRPGAPAAALVVLLALASGVRDARVSQDWGDAFYQRRAGALLAALRTDLRLKAPRPAAHTRFWFSSVPNDIGFMQGDGPALRTWYRDTTLRGGFFSAWRPAPAGAPGADRFFKLRGGTFWVELVAGPEDAAAARAANLDWAEDHLALGSTFAEGGDWRMALREYHKLATALPQDAEAAYNVAASLQALGDVAGAERWLAEARRRPVVSERLRRTVRAAGLGYW